MFSDFSFFEVTLLAGNTLLGIGVLFAAARLIKGPGVIDRIVALDLIAGVAVGFSALLALEYDDPAYLNIALCLAVIVFISTVALTLYLEKTSNHD